MPSKHYRRRLINKYKTHTKYLLNHILSCNIQNTSLLNNIQQYFLDIIDSIILYSDMNSAIKQIQSLITIISSKEDVFLLLDNIQNNILSIIQNISDGETIGIICQRINYIRELIYKLPNDCNNYEHFGELFIDIINTITTNINFNIVNANIIFIQSLLNTNLDLELYNNIQLIQTTLFSIITNITNGESLEIINTRVLYLKSIINNLNC
jgi:cob(I)alamin adenosyltransferase